MLRDLSALVYSSDRLEYVILGFRSGRLNSDLISWVPRHPLIVGRPYCTGPNRFVVVTVKSVDLFVYAHVAELVDATVLEAVAESVGVRVPPWAPIADCYLTL